MSSNREDLVSELKILRKGRGLAGHIEGRVGPVLRSTSGVSENDGLEAIRAKVSDRLSELASQLPDDLRLAALAAFAIAAEARQPLYQDRVRWAASRVDRDPRTVRRRVDEAIALLAELSVGSENDPNPAAPVDGWHTSSLRLWMSLTLSKAECFEVRRIIADTDGISRIRLAISGYQGAYQANENMLDLSTLNIFEGGTLRDHWIESSDRIGMTLELPRPLSRGESHEIALRFESQNEQSYCICTPKTPCDFFNISVRFNHHAPDNPKVLEGAFQRDVTDPRFSGRSAQLNEAGEMISRFRNLTPGLAYGFRWSAHPQWGIETH